MKARGIILAAVLLAALAAAGAEPIPLGLVEALFPNSAVRPTSDGLLVTARGGQTWHVGRHDRVAIFRCSDGRSVIRARTVGSPENWKVEYGDGRTATVTVRENTARLRVGGASKDRTSRRSRDGWSTSPSPR